MENLVCALVEKQFVTTFPGAVKFQVIEGYLPYTLGGRTGQLQAAEKGP